MNRNPGCLSIDGFFLEHSPIKWLQDTTSKKYKLIKNDYLWHKAPAWMLYINQPVRTGLSFTHKQNFCINEGEVNCNFQFFLQEFFMTYLQYFLNNKLSNTKTTIFFSGKLYTRHYIPSMMQYMLKNPLPALHIDFGGALIGNGWTDPYHRYSPTDFAYSMGLIGLAAKQLLEKSKKECQNLLD